MSTGGAGRIATQNLVNSYQGQVLVQLSRAGVTVAPDSQFTYDQAISSITPQKEFHSLQSSQLLAKNIDSDKSGQISLNELGTFFARADQRGNQNKMADETELFSQLAQGARSYIIEHAGSLSAENKIKLQHRLLSYDFSVTDGIMQDSTDLLRETRGGYYASHKMLRAAAGLESALKQVEDPAQKSRLAHGMLTIFAEKGTMPAISRTEENTVVLMTRSARKVKGAITLSQNSYFRTVDLQTGAIGPATPPGDLDLSTEHTVATAYSAASTPVIRAQGQKLRAAISQPENRRALASLYDQLPLAVETLAKDPASAQLLIELVRPVKDIFEKAYGLPQTSLDIKTLYGGAIANYDSAIQTVNLDPEAMTSLLRKLRADGKTESQIKEAMADQVINLLIHETTHSDQLQISFAPESAVPAQKPRVREYAANYNDYVTPRMSEALNGTRSIYENQPIEADARNVAEAITRAIKNMLAQK